MPYITIDRQVALDIRVDTPRNAGELNYIFTRTLMDYLKEKGLCYQRINDVIGALEGAKAEFYRRVVVPYEDKKIQENGDVYDNLLGG